MRKTFAERFRFELAPSEIQPLPRATIQHGLTHHIRILLVPSPRIPLPFRLQFAEARLEVLWLLRAPS